MPLAPGERLGPYAIVAPLGAGGMGEVYRARDPRIGRDVAIKVLPEDFADDPDRLARLRREAQVLGSLNHPHIAAIYGLEDQNGVTALVLELIEGPTLADRIAQGPLPVDEALPMAKQIAEALEAAHECGVIHRDLKPANIKLTPNGSAKVLDFGLAKALDAEGASQSASLSPTLSLHATHAGVILGTAAYMSPEQARGRVVDKRTDIWAFGCVLYEMLTGRRAFEGEDASETMAFVITKEPDWNALPAWTPASIQKLLRRCLQRTRSKRLADIGDAKLEIEDAITDPHVPNTAPATVVRPQKGRTLLLSASVIAVAILSAAAMWGLDVFKVQEPSAVMRFVIAPSPGDSLSAVVPDRPLAISPDGKHIVYVGRDGLLVRRIDRIDATLVPGPTVRSPFISADSKWVGFFASGELRKIALSGGSAIPICRFAGGPRGASWAPDNTIVFATTDRNTGLLRVPSGGGEPLTLTTPDKSRRELDHLFPFVLPNGRGVLFTVTKSVTNENSQIAVFDYKTRTYKILIENGSQPEFVEGGYLVYMASKTLRAVRFDADRFEVTGDPIAIPDDVGMFASGAAAYSVSRSGTIVYAPNAVTGFGATRSLVWVDRQGHEEAAGVPPRGYYALRLSPDGARVAVDVRDQENDIWIWHIVRRTLTKLTFSPALDVFPVWTPDGHRVVFSSTRSGTQQLYSQAADGTGTSTLLRTVDGNQFVGSVAPDGKTLVVVQNAPATGNDIFKVTLDANDSGEVLIQTPAAEGPAELSMDGRWLAYQSDESGQDEIYVRPFPDVDGGRWQVSPSGGRKALWSKDGRELFYWDFDDTLMSVPIEPATTFRFGTPTKLFQGTYVSAVQARSYDVTRDGKRFLVIKEIPQADGDVARAPLIVVVNWVEELRERFTANP
jgi:serine/threonine protein kinase